MNGTNTEKKHSPASVLLVDDHPVVLEGLTSFINQQSDMMVCGAVTTGRTTIEAVDRLKPDVVIVDISLAGSDGIDLIGDLRRHQPEMAIVVFSMHDEMLYAERALRAGARGYVMKNHGAEMLLKAIRHVLSGRIFTSDEMREIIFDKLVAHDGKIIKVSTDSLTDREMQVFRLIGQGRTSREIAAVLNVSAKTVEVHREHIKAKLNLKNSAQLIHFASQYK